jgi:hypothetical protein
MACKAIKVLKGPRKRGCYLFVRLMRTIHLECVASATNKAMHARKSSMISVGMKFPCGVCCNVNFVNTTGTETSTPIEISRILEILDVLVSLGLRFSLAQCHIRHYLRRPLMILLTLTLVSPQTSSYLLI